jgi:hypothetical protein
MKIHKALILVLLLATTSVVRAGPPNYGDLPAKLADVPAIKFWAERNSWGGSTVDVLKSAEAEVVAVQRSLTSGLLTTGLVVFVRIDGHWEPGLILRTVTGYTYRLVQDGDYVHLRSSLSGKEIGGFSISGLGQDYVGWASKAKTDAGRDTAAQQGVAPDGRSPSAPARR